MKHLLTVFTILILSHLGYTQCAVVSPYPDTDPCYQQVIAADTWCCNNSWDGICQAAYDACTPIAPPTPFPCTNPLLTQTEGWNDNTITDPWVIPGTTYGGQTPQTHGPRTGTHHLYLNFQNGFIGMAYSRTIPVCPNENFEISCWMHDTWGGTYDVTIEVWDGATLLNTQTLNSNGAYFQYSSTELTALTGGITWNVINNSASIGNNDFAMDDFAVTVCDCSSLLPVDLMSFNGSNQSNINKIKWETVSETNNAYFTLEHSLDGTSWRTISTINGAGNSSTLISYSFNHDSYSNSINYYRLSQTDFDGSSESFDIISVDNTLDSKTLLKTINYLGQEIQPGDKGLFIEIYSDGTRRKVYK